MARMDAGKKLYEAVSNITECPICRDTIEESRMLPCIHTFCLKCLEKFWSDKIPEDNVPCPVCRSDFEIPKSGLGNLPKNSFVEKLIEAQKISSVHTSSLMCDICSCLKNEEGTDVAISPASKHCMECLHNLCTQCSKIHMITNSSKFHRLKAIGEVSETNNYAKYSMIHCDQHEGEKIKIYCLECKSAICTTCFIIKHNGHKCSDLNEAAKDLKVQIARDIEDNGRRLQELKHQLDELKTISRAFVDHICATEAAILQRGDEIKLLVDEQIQVLLHDLNVQKSKIMKDIEISQDELLIRKISIDSFIKFSQEIHDKAIPADIPKLSSELNVRAASLRQLRIIQIGNPVRVSFTPYDLAMDRKAGNLVGDIKVMESVDLVPVADDQMGVQSGTTHQANDSEVPNIATPEDKLADNSLPGHTAHLDHETVCDNEVTGLTRVGEKLYVVRARSSRVEIYDDDTLILESHQIIPVLIDPYDIVGCRDGDEHTLYVSERNMPNIHKLQMSTKTSITWKVRGCCLTLSLTDPRKLLTTSCQVGHVQYIDEYNTENGNILRKANCQSNLPSVRFTISINADEFFVCSSSRIVKCHIRDYHMRINYGCFNEYTTKQSGGCGCTMIPTRLIFDNHGFMFVLGQHNNIRVLNKRDMKLVCECVPPTKEPNLRRMMCLDAQKQRLYVADHGTGHTKLMSFDIRYTASFVLRDEISTAVDRKPSFEYWSSNLPN